MKLDDTQDAIISTQATMDTMDSHEISFLPLTDKHSSDEEFAKVDAKKNRAPLFSINKESTEDEEAIKKMLAQNGLALEFIDSKYRKESKIVKVAINQNPRALLFADNILKKDKKIALEAVSKCCWVLYMLSDELQRDSEVIEAARKRFRESQEPAGNYKESKLYYLIAGAEPPKQKYESIAENFGLFISYVKSNIDAFLIFLKKVRCFNVA
jgi:hypothetical protein